MSIENWSKFVRSIEYYLNLARYVEDYSKLVGFVKVYPNYPLIAWHWCWYHDDMLTKSRVSYTLD